MQNSFMMIFYPRNRAIKKAGDSSLSKIEIVVITFVKVESSSKGTIT